MSYTTAQLNKKVRVSLTTEVKGFSCSKVTYCQIERRIFHRNECHFTQLFSYFLVSFLFIQVLNKISPKKAIDQLASRLTVPQLNKIVIGQKHKYSSLNIDSQPRASRDQISASIDIFIFLERLKGKSVSLSLLFSVESHNKFDKWVGFGLNAEESNAHSIYNMTQQNIYHYILLNKQIWSISDQICHPLGILEYKCRCSSLQSNDISVIVTFQLVRQQMLIMHRNIKLLFLIFTLSCLTLEQTYQVNLDLPSTQRYLQLSRVKRDSIASFINYLKQTVPKYKIAFNLVDRLHSLSPSWIKQKVGAEFYQECQSIATGSNLPLSQIIVFNYMYELGAATDFCTAITVSDNELKLLGRNLDYGYQQYLASNSVQIKYLSKGKVVFQTLGHAGFVGTHTVLKRETQDSPYQYALTLNEREQGGLHLTLQKMVISNCQTSPYAIMKTLKYCKGDINAVVQYLNSFDTCAAVYYTIIDKHGESYVIQKNRGQGSNKIRSSNTMNGINFIVQTNHDYDTIDPDGRSTAALTKLNGVIQNSGKANSSDIWRILTEKPNFNNLTLMTGVIDVEKGEINHQVWEKSNIL